MKRIIFFVITAIALSLQNGFAQWYTVNTAAKTLENSQISIRYIDPSNYWGNGIEMINKITGEKIGHTLDTYGYGSAEYDNTGPSTFALGTANGTYVETDVRFTDGVSVRKTDRLYKDHAVLEIHYDVLSCLWFEDYWDNAHTPTVYAIDGIPRDITKDMHAQYLTYSETNTGHNYFDSWIQGAGYSVSDVTYKGHIIFGSHSLETGRGIGEVYPVAFGTHHFKLWFGSDTGNDVPNYECFPADKNAVKRWIFAYEGGREGMSKIGRAIVDAGRPPANQVTFSMSLPQGSAPYDITFTNTSTDGYGTWSWNFDDGGTASGENSTHTFDADGTYRITLTGSGSAGTETFSLPLTLPMPDYRAPEIDTVYSTGTTSLTVVFSEAVNTVIAGTPGSYKLSRGKTVTGAHLQSDGKTVELTSAEMDSGINYKLTVLTMRDLQGNSVVNLIKYFEQGASGAGVHDIYAPVSRHQLQVYPFPCRKSVVIIPTTGSTADGDYIVTITDLHGLPVRTGRTGAGKGYAWDLTDESGDRILPGLYIAAFSRDGQQTGFGRIMVAR